MEAYNSDSGDEDFQMDDMSDEGGGRGGHAAEAEDAANQGWIQWFCALEGHDYMVELDAEYIKDPFNLYGLQGLQPNLTKDKFKQCIKMISSPQSPDDKDLADEQFMELNQEASELYGLIHARYINSACGMAKVYHKFLSSLYGTCPRALCDRQKVLPVGMSDSLKVSRFKVYCPRCEEVYVPKFKVVNIDGAFFGTSFPHHFLKHYKTGVILPPKIYHYEPKIYGFKIVGKRGSKFYDPPLGNIKYNFDTMTGIDKEKLVKKAVKEGRTNRFAQLQGGAFSSEVQSMTQRTINQNFFVSEVRDADTIIAEAVSASNGKHTQQSIMDESNDTAATQNKGKKNKKKK